jgi:putative spermidine/putrescine transport system ATP-binding protein
MPSAVQIAGLTRFHRGRSYPASLNAFSLDVPERHFVAVIGPAGAGKSTLLRILAGAERQSAGSVLHHGFASHQIGSLLQTDALSARQTVAENVASPLRRLRGNIDRKTAARLTANALELLQLSPVARHFPQNTDQATRLRTLLARAVVGEPKLLLLDEPFAHQDEEGSLALARTLRHVHELLGTTTILATRRAASALPLADMLALLWQGRLVEAGTPRAVYDSPGSAVSAGLIGPVNRLEGTVVAMSGDIAAIRLACGPVVEARMPGILAPGTACTLCIRPERIAIAATSAADFGENALDATIIAQRFAGATTRLHMLIGSGVELIVDRPSATAMRGLSAGEQAAVAWQPHHALAFAAGATA